MGSINVNIYDGKAARNLAVFFLRFSCQRVQLVFWVFKPKTPVGTRKNSFESVVFI